MMYLCSAIIIILQVSGCLCGAQYDIFQGFASDSGVYDNDDFNATTTDVTTTDATTTDVTTTDVTTTDVTNISGKLKSKIQKIQPIKFKCPEEEKPSNIGPYEVPTQRDLVLHMKNTLMRRFNSYHKKALRFLQDIRKASSATVEVEKKCKGHKEQYRQCVKSVSNKCEVITKSLVTSLEMQRHDVNAFTEGQVCNMTSMKQNPVTLIKIVAMEGAAIDFALPGFLRLLSSCSRYCASSYKSKNKPMRHMTDTDLVVKHFLTRKSYKQLLMESNYG